MQQFSLCSSKLKRISNIIFLISVCSMLVFFVILVDNVIVKTLSFLGLGFFITDLLITEIIPKKVFFENGILYLKFMSNNFCIKLKDVVWYSKNHTGMYTLFCKSNKNICLFYLGKKHYISIEEQDIVESYLIKNEIPKSTIENESSFKLNSIYGMYLDFKFVIIPFIIVQTKIWCTKIDNQSLKNFIFVNIMIMLFCVFVLFIISIINDIAGKQKKTEE